MTEPTVFLALTGAEADALLICARQAHNAGRLPGIYHEAAGTAILALERRTGANECRELAGAVREALDGNGDLIEAATDLADVVLAGEGKHTHDYNAVIDNNTVGGVALICRTCGERRR